jgi:hypothetical protein
MTRLAGGYKERKEKMAKPFSLFFFPFPLMATSFRSRATRGKESGGLSSAVFH